jgi:hypothetical protein
MYLNVMVYRLFRLRRLILVSVLPPCLAVLAIYVVKGPSALYLLPFALLGPGLHILRYPNAWTESLAVSLTLSVVLGLAGTVGTDVGLIGLSLRLVGLGVVGVIVFLAVSTLGAGLLFFGPEKEFTVSAHRKSRLDPATLKKRITLYPGRVDDRVSCGQAREDGVFPVTMKHQISDLSDAGSEQIDVTYFGFVLTDRPELHELIAIPGDGGDTSTTQHSFIEQRKGTIVNLSERSLPVTYGFFAGYWLQDYLADHLTDEIDHAEGRAMRANRFQKHDMLLLDFARFFARPGKGATPAE